MPQYAGRVTPALVESIRWSILRLRRNEARATTQRSREPRRVEPQARPGSGVSPEQFILCRSQDEATKSLRNTSIPKKAKSPAFPLGSSYTLALAYFPQRIAPPVSSALRRFTAVFGMGTGGATSL